MKPSHWPILMITGLGLLQDMEKLEMLQAAITAQTKYTILVIK